MTKKNRAVKSMPSINAATSPPTGGPGDSLERPVETPEVVSEDGEQRVGRTKTAELLNTSISKVRRLEDRDELPAIVDERGYHFHTLTQINNFKIRNARATGKSDGIDGSIAAAVFELFDQGKNPVDVVKELHLDPRLVQQLYKQWVSLRGGFIVSGRVATELEYCGLGGELGSLKTEDDLLRLFLALERQDQSTCLCCERFAPKFCAHCTIDQPNRVQRLAQVELREARRRQEARRQRELDQHAAARAREAAGNTAEAGEDDARVTQRRSGSEGT
jgi:hypothetical protein